jgi:hypothetical protein
MCIESALEQTNGNVTEAARLLGVNRSHLYTLFERHGQRLPKTVRSTSTMTEMAGWRRSKSLRKLNAAVSKKRTRPVQLIRQKKGTENERSSGGY